MTINIKEILEDFYERYGKKLEVDGYYGEQCTIEKRWSDSISEYRSLENV